MCGIIGYIGNRAASGLLLEGLKRMEYRGYDSAGVAVMNGNGVETRKAAGKISQLERALAASPVHGEMGIGHTRWATHGVPNECNAHPHTDCKGRIAVVHNGIIENSGTLKQGLQARGHKFASDTDTEVIAHLIEEAFDGNLEDAVIEALWQIEGTYGIAVVASLDPVKIVAARKGSPLLIGLGNGEYYVASDVSAILAHTREVVYLDDGDVAVLTREGYTVLNQRAQQLERRVSKIDWDLDQIERGVFDHFRFIPPPPFPVVGTGTWKAKKFVSFTLAPVHPPSNPEGRHGVLQAGILKMTADFHPQGGGRVKGVALEVVCNLGPAGANNPGKEEGVYITLPNGHEFEPTKPTTTGVTVFSTNDGSNDNNNNDD